MPYNLSRPNYYDRNPKNESNTSIVVVGATSYSATQEWSYTVPTGRKAYIEFCMCQVAETAGVAINGEMQAYVKIVDDNSNTNTVLNIDLEKGQAGQSQTETLSGMGLLNPSNVLEGYIQSGNTASGSNGRITVGYKITEFDA